MSIICFFSRDLIVVRNLFKDIPKWLHPYIITLGINYLTETYIVTDDYKQLFEMLASENRIILKGPKGCGKSLLLLKLLSDLMEREEQILYFNANTLTLFSETRKNILRIPFLKEK